MKKFIDKPHCRCLTQYRAVSRSQQQQALANVWSKVPPIAELRLRELLKYGAMSDADTTLLFCSVGERWQTSSGFANQEHFLGHCLHADDAVILLALNKPDEIPCPGRTHLAFKNNLGGSKFPFTTPFNPAEELDKEGLRLNIQNGMRGIIGYVAVGLTVNGLI